MTHLFLITILIFSIYLTRYAHVYNLRQKMCDGSPISKTIWITRSGTVENQSYRVEGDGFNLFFSREESPRVGERIELIGRIRDRSQCLKKSQIDLIIQRYIVIEKIDDSPLYSYHIPLVRLLVYTNRYLQSAEEKLYKALPSEHVHILLGMTLGRKYSAQENVSIAMKSAGLTHVMVASGANIAILMTFLHAVLRKISSRKMVYLLSVIVACLYTVIVGNQAPILRAFFMFLLSTLAVLIGRKTNSFYILFISGGILLIIQPFLLFSLSYWLTISATAAICVEGLRTDHKKQMSEGVHQSEIVSTLTTIGTVFLFTTPLLLFSIGTVSLITILSSMVLLWMVTPMTLMGVWIILIHSLVPNWIFQLVCIIPWVFTELFIRFVNLFSVFTYLTISTDSVSLLGIVLYYSILFSWILLRLAASRRVR